MTNTLTNTNTNRDIIQVYDANGQLLGEIKRTNHQRFSQRAAADHKLMDRFKANNPAAEYCFVGTMTDRFIFQPDGSSYSTFTL